MVSDFFSFFCSMAIASFASLATWSLLFHLSLLLISLWSSAQNILIMPKLIYLLRNEASGELFESVLRLHIHRIWFSESSLGPRNLSFYKHLIGIWCRWSFEKHWFRTFIYFIFYKKVIIYKVKNVLFGLCVELSLLVYLHHWVGFT